MRHLLMVLLLLVPVLLLGCQPKKPPPDRKPFIKYSTNGLSLLQQANENAGKTNVRLLEKEKDPVRKEMLEDQSRDIAAVATGAEQADNQWATAEDQWADTETDYQDQLKAKDKKIEAATSSTNRGYDRIIFAGIIGIPLSMALWGYGGKTAKMVSAGIGIMIVVAILAKSASPALEEGALWGTRLAIMLGGLWAIHKLFIEKHATANLLVSNQIALDHVPEVHKPFVVRAMKSKWVDSTQKLVDKVYKELPEEVQLPDTLTSTKD